MAVSVPSASSVSLSLTLPSHTVYVTNLNERIRLDELKRSLYLVFSQFGPIVSINANNTYKLRGQAWIAFESLAAASRAVKEMGGFLLYQKAINVAFAKQEADAVAKRLNTFKQRPKRKQEGQPLDGTMLAEQHKQRPSKRIDAPAVAPIAQPWPPAPPVAAPAVPNRILFVENLPVECSELMLNMLFQQYRGYRESRLVPSKPGIAFVEFEDAAESAVAMAALQEFKITQQHKMKISFAKK